MVYYIYLFINYRADSTKKQPFDYYLFFDVEATCEADGGFEYPNEIIEFPIVLVEGESFNIVSYFFFLFFAQA